MFKKYPLLSHQLFHIFRNKTNKNLQDIYAKYIKLLRDIRDLNEWRLTILKMLTLKFIYRFKTTKIQECACICEQKWVSCFWKAHGNAGEKEAAKSALKKENTLRELICVSRLTVVQYSKQHDIRADWNLDQWSRTDSSDTHTYGHLIYDLVAPQSTVEYGHLEVDYATY